jgi:hypothetical protein
MIAAVSSLMQQEFSEKEIMQRRQVLDHDFNNSSNARRLCELIFAER